MRRSHLLHDHHPDLLLMHHRFWKLTVVAVLGCLLGAFAARALTPSAAESGTERMPEREVLEVNPASATAVEDSVGSILELTKDLSGARGLQAVDVTRAASVVADEGARDDEWLIIPRNDFDFADHVASLPQDIQANQFLRHVALNPRDQWIAPDERRALDEILRGLGRKFAAFEQAQIQGLQADFASASADQRQWLPEAEASAVPGDEPGSLVYRGECKNWIIAFEGNRAYTVPTPTSNFAVRHRALLVEEVGAAIVEWFRLHGLCSASEAEAIVLRVFETAEAACAIRR